jgi:hypothetical protein
VKNGRKYPYLCLPERPAQGLGGVSREVASGARNQGIGPGAGAGDATCPSASARSKTTGMLSCGGEDGAGGVSTGGTASSEFFRINFTL